jgi:hypothetical protein
MDTTRPVTLRAVLAAVAGAIDHAMRHAGL